jgi:hypothetical protein
MFQEYVETDHRDGASILIFYAVVVQDCGVLVFAPGSAGLTRATAPLRPSRSDRTGLALPSEAGKAAAYLW